VEGKGQVYTSVIGASHLYIGGRDNNEVDKTVSLDNTAINQDAETKGIVMLECEVNNFDNVVTTEGSVGMSATQLQGLPTNAISTLRTDIVKLIETDNSKFQVECSNLKSDFLTITEQLDTKFHAATENLTVKLQQENENFLKN